ncbi:MAG: FtsX-like permease family protein, partial [Erysipelotrichaceae bacterium]|nr:FtsX-like permease family protein [Erysipelotrichaceae bacterium]
NMKLQDLQLYSSYGFDDSDVAALRRQDFTETILASKMVDVFCRNSSDVETVMRIEEAERIMNMFELVEGRMPVRDDEIVIINNPSLSESYRIGDRLTMSLDDEDISEWLENDTYTIVGTVKAPSYMAVMLGTSNLKNKELQTVGYVKKSNFKQEYYTTLYLTVKGASAFNRYSGEYKEFMDNTKADVEVFARHQQDNLKEKLLEEYRQEIEDGQKELEEKKAEGQKKLDDAKSQLDEARIQIIAGETQLTSMKSIVEQTTIEIRTLERQYSATGDTAARIREIERNDPQHRNFTAIMTQLVQDYATYNALKSMQDGQPYQQQIDAARQENQTLQRQLDEQLYPERDRLNSIISSDTATEEEKVAAASQLETVNSQIAENEGRIRANEVLIENLENMSGSSTSAAMQQLDDRYGGSITDTYASYSALYEDYLRMEAMQEEIRIAHEALDRLNTEIRKAQADIASGKVEYEKGLKEYNDGLITFNEEIEKAEADIRKALQDLEELPEAEWMILDQDSHYSTYMYASNTTQMGAIGTVMPILFYLVAALVCMTTMTRLVDEQRGQIGIFRALGFSNAQITSKFVIYVLLATLAGSLIGLISGMAIFPVVIYKTWRLMYDLPDQLYLFPIKNVIICLLAFSALMVAVTCVVTNGSLKEMPSQLMRPKAPKMARKTFVEHIKFIWERLSFTSKITVRNLFRYRARFLMTVIGVAGCTGLLVLGFGIRDSISEVLEIQFNELLKYSSTVYLENDHELSEIVSALESNLDNEYVT